VDVTASSSLLQRSIAQAGCARFFKQEDNK
jgi:hypothetical protein